MGRRQNGQQQKTEKLTEAVKTWEQLVKKKADGTLRRTE
jgi:hypothetical protein